MCLGGVHQKPEGIFRGGERVSHPEGPGSGSRRGRKGYGGSRWQGVYGAEIRAAALCWGITPREGIGVQRADAHGDNSASSIRAVGPLACPYESTMMMMLDAAAVRGTHECFRREHLMGGCGLRP